MEQQRHLNQPKHHFPPPDPWRDELPKFDQQPHCPAWPQHLFLSLFCMLGTATVAIAMWFYNIHLKLTGHTFFNWWTNCCKSLLPQFTWKELFLPYAILPNWKFTDPFIKLKVTWAEWPTFRHYLLWLFFRDSYHSTPTTAKTIKPPAKPTAPPLSKTK